MPVLAGIIGSLIYSIASFLGKFLTKRIAILTAVIAAAVALTAAFFTALAGLFLTIEQATPAVIQDSLCWIVPGNFKTCISAYVAARVIAWAYSWNITILHLKML